MEILIASAIGLLIGCGVYVLLRARTFSVVIGLTLISYGVNLLLFSMGRLTLDQAPLIRADAGDYADPLPQALVLTAIVIGFSMTAFLLVLALRANLSIRSDHIDAGDHHEKQEHQR